MRSAALADIALVRRRSVQIEDAFYDIGEALARLKRPEVWRTLGRKSFADLLAKDLEMSVSGAERVLRTVGLVPRERALVFGETKAAVVAELVEAIPDRIAGAVVPKLLAGQKVKLPAGTVIDTGSDSPERLRDLARELRRKFAGGPVARSFFGAREHGVPVDAAAAFFMQDAPRECLQNRAARTLSNEGARRRGTWRSA